MNTVFLPSALLAGVLVPLLQPLPLTAPVAILEWQGSQLKGTPSQFICVPGLTFGWSPAASRFLDREKSRTIHVRLHQSCKRRG